MKRPTKIIITLLSVGITLLLIKSFTSTQNAAPADAAPYLNPSANHHTSQSKNTTAITKAEECETGLAKACVAQAFESNEPVLWNTKACTLGSAVGCANAAGSYYGAGQLDKSKALFQKACDLQDAISCSNLGVFAEQEKNLMSAINYFDKACLSGHGPSCISWKNNASTLCQSDFPSCLNLIDKLQNNNESTDASYLSNIACEAGHAPACS